MTYDPFTHLHLHTDHSQIDGLQKVGGVVDRAKSIGQTAFAMTDHGTCAGHYKLHQATQDSDIKPLYGIEAYLIHDTHIFSDDSTVDKKERKNNSHCTMIAMTQDGLSDLWTLSSLGYIEGLYNRRAHMDWKMIREVLTEDRKGGIVGTSGCLLAYIPKAILRDDMAEVTRLIGMYMDAFGEGNFFFELHTWQFIDPQTEDQHKLNADMTKVNQTLVELSKKYDIPCIAVCDCHYSDECDSENHGIIRSMNIRSDEGEGGACADWMMTGDEVRYWLGKHGLAEDVIEDAIANTRKIADRAEHISIEPGAHLPKVTQSLEQDIELFDTLIVDGLKRKVLSNDALTQEQKDERIDRAQYERDVIVGKNFHTYFLVVMDYYKWAKDQNWLISVDRGSSGGSLICYLLDINEIDPVEYGLIFERFINPGRDSMPDIDGDFPQSKRGELIHYLQDKYGFFNVAGIGTMARMGPKSLVNDLCKSFKIPFEDSRKISKLLDRHTSFESSAEDEEDQIKDWDDFLESVGPDLVPWIEQYPTLFEKVRELIGTIRSYGTHASGVVISDEPLLGKIPLRVKETKKDGKVVRELVTQFEASDKWGNDLEELGYLKFDVLGLRHLDTLMESDKLIHGDIDPERFYTMRMDDTEAYKDMAEGRAVGVFQCETPSCLPILKRFKPQSERDLSVILAANRPQVIDTGNLERLLQRKEGRKSITYLHPSLEPILGETYGIPLYQEQVLRIFQDIANYSLAESDSIRRILGKKRKDKMAEQKDEFIRRCLASPEFVEGCKDAVLGSDNG